MNVEITGARILVSIPEFFGFMLTESVVITWGVMIFLVILCKVLTSHLEVHPTGRAQVIAEWIVTSVHGLVSDTMGKKYASTWYVPFIGAMFAMSACCSLSSVLGFYAPTSDLSTVLGWALFVFILITYTKITSNGFGGYLKSFTQPVFVMVPMNLISEVATPVSMGFRHFGNIVSGSVITTLIYGALSVLSSAILRHLPGMFGEVLQHVPVFAFGIPAVLSLYFDFFSSLLQAFIFSMLTMMYIAQASGTED